MPTIQGLDLFYTFGESFNIAPGIGIMDFGKGPGTFYPVSLTLSKSFWKRATPYLGCSYLLPFPSKLNSGMVGLGLEAYLLNPMTHRFNILINPEVNLWYDENGVNLCDGCGGSSPKIVPWGSMGVGLCYRF